MRLNVVKLLTYRADFLNSILSHSIWAGFTLVQMLLLTTKTSHVFGWSRSELLVLAAMYNIIFCFFYLFFSRGFSSFSTTINFGRLDGILTKPIDSQFMLTCLYVTYTHLIRFFFGVGFLIFAVTTGGLTITPVAVIETIGLIIFSVMTIYSFWMLVMTLIIWFPKLSNLTDLLYQTNQISKFPQEIYKGASLYLFFVLFPLTVIVVTPTKVLLQQATLLDVGFLIVCAVTLFAITRVFWKYALRFYTSASG